MSQIIETHIDIHAPADRIWMGLTDFSSYPKWNPFLRRIDGPCEEGASIKIRCYPPGWFPLVFHPLITRLDAPHELRWVGRFVSQRIAGGEHVFSLDPTDKSSTRLYQYEIFSGLAVPLMAMLMRKKVTRGFEMMNEALKTWAESEA